MTSTTTREGPVRLGYRLSLSGRGAGAHLVAVHGSERLDESRLRGLLPKLHPLDQAIGREIASSAVFGHLADAQLARVLPLLAQRQTQLGEGNLAIGGKGVVPRLKVEPGALGGVRLELLLVDDKGVWHPLSEGRLVAGTQAFFIKDGQVGEVSSPAPWELAVWAKTPVVELTADLTPQRRDDLVRGLTKLGVPAQDLVRLAVRRAPPDRFVVHLVPRPVIPEAEAQLVLEAEYQGERAAIGGRDPDEAYLVPADPHSGLIERDLAAEHDARKLVGAAGFRFENATQTFVARGEAALRALDPGGGSFPLHWLVDRSGNGPVFRRDLEIKTQVRLIEDRGLFQLDVGTFARDDEDATVRALVEMKDLLAWLDSGARYVRLADGSYVAPSPRFKKNLGLLADLGAQAERALISPMCVGILRELGQAQALEAADKATADWIAEVSGDQAPPHVDPPEELTAVLRDYQKRGLEWLAMLHRHRLTGILADDMGLGKTLQTLTLIALVRRQEGPKPSLVVAPTSVLSVWRDEAARFLPALRVAIWHGAPEERRQIDIEKVDVVITSYGILRRDTDFLSQVGFRYVILDEAQSAKNAATQNARSVRRLKSERRLALTGTPIENRPEELWATFDFLAPGFLGNLRSFRKRYARPIERGEDGPMGLLRARMHPFVMRRLKDEVARELPPKLESVVRCEMGAAQRALYDHLAGELRESVKRKIEKVGIERAHMDVLAALTRLRQICCDPALLPAPPNAKVPESAKLALFEELMREALESERRVIVFSQFVEMQRRIIPVIERLGVKPLWLHGGTRNRDQVVSSFQDPHGPPVIVISLKAGGTGLTLTRADTVMHYDPWWNPAVERQATDRTHRLGQQHQVTVYKLVCAKSIEERVLEMASKKDDLAAALLGSDVGGQKRISAEEILSLLG